MIDRITLRNWRSHADLDLPLGKGTTFLVAANGVGKTSVVLGMQWALFGDLAIPDPRSHVQLGQSDPAEVTVALTLRDGRTLRVSRKATHNRKSTGFEAEVGGRTVQDDEALFALLTDEFRADAASLSALCVLPEFVARRQLSKRDDLLHAHLSAVLGVDNLEMAADQAAAVAKDAAKITRQVRNLELLEEGERANTQQRLDNLERELDDRLQAQGELASRLAERKQLLERLDRWEAHQRREHAAREAEASLAERVAALLDDPVTPANVAERLTDAERQAREPVEAARTTLSELRARVDLTRSLLDQLGSAEGDCPVCLRPLGDSVSDHATGAHEAALDNLTHEIESTDARAKTAADRLGAVHELQTAWRAIERPDTPDDPAPPGDRAAVAEHVERLRERAEATASEVATLRDERRLLQSRLEEDEQTRDARRDLLREFRREALATAAEQALRATAGDIKTARLEPLDAALRDRWKRLMGNVPGLENLGFDSTGPVLRRDGASLNVSRLSGGEQAIAETLTRMLVLTATTRCRFLWLDEPLEHLDPRHRRTFAAHLMKAVEGGELDQVLVTTYEEPLARRLCDEITPSNLVYISRE